jgi:hypothetical protein
VARGELQEGNQQLRNRLRSGFLDEEAFRSNNRRDANDSDRFDLAVRQIVGKRLTWAEVTGRCQIINRRLTEKESARQPRGKVKCFSTPKNGVLFFGLTGPSSGVKWGIVLTDLEDARVGRPAKEEGVKPILAISPTKSQAESTGVSVSVF